MEIVINNCFGGFGLSKEAITRYHELTGIHINEYGWEVGNSDNRLERNDPVLIQIVKELGYEVSHGFANLKIVEVPDDVKWEIESYDGNEWVAECHRKWS